MIFRKTGGVRRQRYAVGVGVVLGFYPQRSGFFRHAPDFIRRIALRHAAGQIWEDDDVAAVRVGYGAE